MNNTLLVINSIILIGGAAAAITNILNILVKGEGFLKKKSSKAIKEQVDSKFNEYSEELSKTRRKEINEEVTTVITESLVGIYDRFDGVNNTFTDINSKLDVLQEGNTDLLRREMLKIYNKYKFTKKIPAYDRQDFYKMLGDYQKEGGNSYAENLWSQLKEWQIVDSEKEALEEEY